MKEAAAMSFETIKSENRGAVCLVTLNRPQALNALNTQLMKELSLALDQAESDASVRCIVITGSEKAFAAGSAWSRPGRAIATSPSNTVCCRLRTPTRSTFAWPA